MINLNGCNFTETTIRATEIFYNFTFYILLPYYLVISPIFNLLLIVALTRCIRAKPPFIYQLMLVCAKSSENLVHSIYLAGAYWWGGLGGYTAPWFSASYVLTFVNMRCLNTAHYFVTIFALFLTVPMAADRVVSLCYPIQYRFLNHRAIRGASLVLSAGLSLGVTLDKYWSNVIVEKLDLNGSRLSYGYTSSSEYNNALWGQISESVRTYVRVSLTIALIALNCLMIDRYRRRMRKIHSMTTTANEEKLRARKEANKEVLILCLCQSILTCFGQIPFTTAQMVRQSSTYWSKCYLVAMPEYIAAIMLANAGEFYVLLAVNGKIRNNLPGYKKMRNLFLRLVRSNDGIPQEA